MEADSKIESRARQYEGAGIRPFDALHLASAVEAGADVFCSADDQLLGRGSEAGTGSTRLLTPVELIEKVQS